MLLTGETAGRETAGVVHPMTRMVLLAGLLLVGCQPAGRYFSKAPTPSRQSSERLPAPRAEEPNDPQSAGIVWQEPDPSLIKPDVPIIFVHERRRPGEWNALPEFWNPDWQRPLSGFGTSSFATAALTGAGLLQPAVRIKVPLGLDDPTPFIPASNPPTVAKWQLGKDLFFDDRVLLQPDDAVTKLSCATCHNPASGFTDPKLSTRYSRWDTPTLFNCVYQRHQFWDGRVALLEQVVQQSLEDEKAPNIRRFHAWPGVVQRLREEPGYSQRFQAVFGTVPTQDAVGKALATYLRTILIGNSVQDRAEKAQRDRGGAALTVADYEQVIDAATLESLPWRHGPKPSRSELAAELLKGHTLFHGKAACVRCHSGRNYSDDDFHNLGIAESSMRRIVGKESGRFATAPAGDKGLHRIGAFKTPTLRGLPRTAPYFHNGSYLLIDLDEVLFEVIVWHVDKVPPRRAANPYLDPELRRVGLKEDEIRSLVVFLKALDGDPVPAVLQDKKR